MLAQLKFVLLALLLVGCKTSGPESAKGGQPAKQGVPQTQQQQTQQTQNATASGAVDVVVVSAIGAENPELRTKNKAAIDKLLAAIVSKMATQATVNLALIASPNGAVSGIPVTVQASGSVPASRIKQVNFEMATKDIFIGTLAAICAKADSNLDEDQHKAGKVTLCKKTVSIPAHSWTWANQDVQGTLATFLRPGAKRIFIFIANNDATVVSPTDFVELSRSSNQGGSSTIFAIAPGTSMTGCNAQNKTATNLSAAASFGGGALLSYCDANWDSHIQKITSNL